MIRLVLLAALALAAAPARADRPVAWTAPVAPFPIAGGIHYVGTEGLAAYLVVSDGEAALIDGTLDENVPQIEANIRRLGLRLDQVRVLLNTHAHQDHAAGLARLKRDTHARLFALGPDVWALEHGRHQALNENGQDAMPPVKVDRALRDGERVTIGAITLTAIATPGHTAGCTSWSATVSDGGRPRRVLVLCSLSVAGNLLVGNTGYPGIVADYRRTFARLARIRADIVLPGHPEIADVIGRARRREAGERDAFVDPALLPKLVAAARADFERQAAAAR